MLFVTLVVIMCVRWRQKARKKAEARQRAGMLASNHNFRIEQMTAPVNFTAT